MIAYVDASALVKIYIEETGSAAVRDLLHRNLTATSRLTAVEVASAFVRRGREGSLDLGDRDQLLRDLREDMTVLYVVELAPAVVNKARALLLRHALRAADAVQLASCLVLHGTVEIPMVFAAYDQRLLEAARQEGIETFSSEE